MLVTIEVGPDEIAAGLPDCPEGCPVYYALMNALAPGVDVYVEGRLAYLTAAEEDATLDLGPSVAEKVCHYDLKAEMEPFSFTAEIPDHFLPEA